MKNFFCARRFLTATTAFLVAMTALGWHSARPASALTSLTLTGHGFGHGRGAGQYGALGYAQGGWTSAQILDRYYGGTTDGTRDPNTPMTVRMTVMDQQPTVVFQERGQMVTNADDSLPGGRQNRTALWISRVAANSWEVWDGPSCQGPWTKRAANVNLPNVVMAPTVRNEDRGNALQLCEPSGARRWLFGDLVAVQGNDSKQYTSNTIPLDQYVRGVVPREMPASWGDNVGGKGMEALKTQAVAARSYGLSEARYTFAKTCDTTACQVYGGRAVQIGGNFTNLEDPRSDNAVSATAGHIRLLNGNVARTEYSSSTGGYTAGGTFPAVFDEGDAVANNPYHNWTQTIPASTIEAKYNKGSLQGANVTSRNGLGTDGGRVNNLRLTFSGGTVDVTGNDFQAAFGLKSNWFSVAGPAGEYNPLVPARILDSRAGQPAADDYSNAWPANTTRAVQVAGRGGVPTGASAVALNVTAANATATSGYLTVFPSDMASPPIASNINFQRGRVVPNLVLVKLAGDGAIKIFNSPGGSTDVIADVVGYFGNDAQSTDGRLVPLSPARVLDSRPGEAATDEWNNPWPADTARSVVIAGKGGVPVDATAVALNVTVTNTNANSYLTAWPTGASRPVASNLNWVPGQTVPNRVIVKLGNAGSVSLYNAVGTTDVIADVVGYFTSGTAPSSTSGIFHPIAPARLLDSRPGETAPDPYTSPWPANFQRGVPVANLVGIPGALSGVVLNVTVVNTKAHGYLTLFPTGSPPHVSDVNFAPGLTIANLAIAKVHTDGTLQIYNAPGGTTDVIADATGYFG
jgi:SpoIID/LytB domain protein